MTPARTGTSGSTSGSTGTSGNSNSSSNSSGGHVDASSAIDHPIYLDDLSEYSRPKPNKDTADQLSPHADDAIPAGSTVNRDSSNTDINRGSTDARVNSSVDSSSTQSNLSGQALSSASDVGQVRQVLASTTEAALAKDSCERLVGNFDRIDRQRLDMSQAKFDDLNMKIDQFNQDWREKYGQDFTIRQPAVVFNDEYRFMPGGVSTPAARTASDVIAPSTGDKDLSSRSDYTESRIQYRTTTSDQSSPASATGSARITSDRGDSDRVSSEYRIQRETVASNQTGANPTGQLVPSDATYHDGTKMKADGTIQRNDITSVNSRPGEVNVPTGNSVNDRDSANHDRPDNNTAAIQRDVIDAAAQQPNQRIERAYTDTTVHTDAAAANSNSVNLQPGQSAEIDSNTGAVRRDVTSDNVALRGPSDNSQAASDVQTSTNVERAMVIIPASHGMQQLSVPMIKEDGQWKLCVPDNEDAQKLHDSLLRQITMLDDQKATWPSDVNDASRMVNHHVLAAIYESQQRSASLDSDK